jgi:hypothetical protein
MTDEQAERYYRHISTTGDRLRGGLLPKPGVYAAYLPRADLMAPVQRRQCRTLRMDQASG